MMSTLSRLQVRLFSSSFALLTLAGISLVSARLLAQTTPAISTSAAAKPTGTGSATASGFSIETEMLTYRALESNGEAIACDVAAYLYNTKTDFKNLPGGAICNVGNSSAPNIGVIVLPFDRSAFADFQIWRSDMQTMAEFEARSAGACGERAPGRTRGATTGSSSSTAAAAASVGSVMGALTPAGAMLATGSGILGLFAHSQDSSPVGGTIEDQAFMDNVSRELRSVNVSVIMPTAYAPFALTSVDPTRSPFVTALDKLLHTRDCLLTTKPREDPDIKNIEEFLNAISGTTTPAKPAAPTSSQAAASGTAAPASATTAPAAPSQSHLNAVLTADGLAQRLGADPATGHIPDTSPHHILLVKALESGGSVSRSSSIFGTHMSYSGGSVGTYALFNLNGDLECSGNVYDYAGYMPAKDFQKKLRAYKPDPQSQVI
ncbi:MAG: hypothetical protein M3O31_17850 [Acidobacteriota bacterium]|nr:hypothetical protein [Acidobacteriota bacterium]